MAHTRIRTLTLCGVLTLTQAAVAASAAPLSASPPNRPSAGPAIGSVPFPDTGLLSRALQGLRIPVAPSWRGWEMGRAQLIGGAETEAGRPSVFSGLLWRMNAGAGRRVRLGVLQSGVDAADADGGETLAVGALDLTPAASVYLPDLAVEYAVMHGGADKAGRRTRGIAGGLRLNGRMANADYHMRVARSQPGFRPLGATIAPGRVVGEAGASYPLPGWYRVRIDTRAFRDNGTASAPAGQVHRAALSGPAPSFLPGLDTIRFRGVHERHRTSRLRRVWRVALDGSGVNVRDWQLGGGFTWENRVRRHTPAARYGWRMRGERPLDLAAFNGLLRSSVALRRAVGDRRDWGVSADVNVHTDTAPGGWVLQLEYKQPAASPRAFADDAPRVMLNIRFDGGAAAFAAADPGGSDTLF